MSFMNPRRVVEEGWVFTPEDCTHPFESEVQVQQAGIDLRMENIFRMLPHDSVEAPDYALVPFETPIGFIGVNEKQLPLYQRLDPNEGQFSADRGNFRISPGAYTIDFIEHVKVPINAMALIIHRSTLNRSGALLTGSVFDPGFSGQIGCTMYVHHTIIIEPTARLAQIVFIEGEAASAYEGAYKDQTHGDTSGAKIG